MPVTTFPLSGPIDVQVRIGHGSLTINAVDDLSEAVVELEPRHQDSDIVVRTAVAMQGRSLVVATPRRGGIFDLSFFGGSNDSRDSIDIVLTVPSGTAVKASSFTAPITTTGRLGKADIAAGAANIDLDTIDGSLRLRFGSGNAEVATVTGSAEVRSGSGDARFGEVGGDLSCGCGSGTLDVGTARGSVRGRSGSGSASIAAVYGDVDLASGSGGVTIGLPSGHSARLELTTGSGRVESELEVEDGPGTQTKRISIRARTGSGDIRLVRAA